MKQQLAYISLLILFLINIQISFADTLSFSRTYGNFGNAVSISTGRGEFIFISDVQTNQVFKYSKGGVEIARFGGTGFGANGLNNPVSVDAGNGLDVYVSDNLNNRIQKLDYKLNYITAFDFNAYNQTADNSRKIINPAGLTTLSSGDLAVIIRSSEYKAAIVSSFSDINVFLGSNFGFDRIGAGKKVVRGSGLDLWILDADNFDVVNFTTNGIFVKRLREEDIGKTISIAFFDDNLYILNDKYLLKYDLKGNKFDNIINYDSAGVGKVNDFAILNKSTFLFLTSSRIYEYILTK
jgi:hypothetical protein